MKITKKQLRQIIKEELAAIQRLNESAGEPRSAEMAMAQIAALVKSTAAQTVPDQALATIRDIAREWENAELGVVHEPPHPYDEPTTYGGMHPESGADY